MSQQFRETVNTCGVCATYSDKQEKETEVMEIPAMKNCKAPFAQAFSK